MKIQNRDLKKYVVELVGTFSLTLAVSLVLTSQSVAQIAGFIAPLIAAFTLALFVYTVSHVSGTHINPAVTLGAWSIGKISRQDVVGYLVAQFAGAAASVLFVTKGLDVVLQPAQVIIGWQVMVWVMLAEAVGTALFVFGISAVVYGKVSDAAKGWVIGMSLFLGILLASGLGSNGILNPAVAFGVNSFSWMYIIGPILGSVAGMQVYKYLAAN